jgi:molybdopterin-guanine dinucleotide biosynthesis protein MobB
MNRIHVVGRKNHGKTTLVVELVEALTARGVRVGTIKHSPHQHEVDTPTKDSHRHRQAGGQPAALITPSLLGLFLSTVDQQDPYALLAPMFNDCDLVIVEGNTDADAPKLEVWRRDVCPTPLAATVPGIKVIVTDDPIDGVPVPCCRRSEISAVVGYVLRLAEIDPRTP